jgi:hypothetical protein
LRVVSASRRPPTFLSATGYGGVLLRAKARIGCRVPGCSRN